MPRQRLVYGVVDDLPQAVHEAAAVIGADIHAGPFAYGFKALKNGQVLRGISRILGHIATVGAGPLREGLPRVLVHLCQIRRQRTIPAWRGGNV